MARTSVDEAAEIAMEFGGIDGAHHKQWVIDQMLRTLLGPERYADWRHFYELEDYEWDEGIAP